MNIKNIKTCLSTYFLRFFAKQLKLKIMIDKKYNEIYITFEGKMLNCSNDIDHIFIKYDNDDHTLKHYQHYYINNGLTSMLFFTQFDLSIVNALKELIYD